MHDSPCQFIYFGVHQERELEKKQEVFEKDHLIIRCKCGEPLHSEHPPKFVTVEDYCVIYQLLTEIEMFRPVCLG